MPEVIVFDKAGDFLKETLDLLLEHEAENNLILGLAMQIYKNPGKWEIPPFFAVVKEDQKCILAALMTPPRSMILTAFIQESAPALSFLTDTLWQMGVSVSGVNAEKRLANQFAHLWSHRASFLPKLQMNERVYRLDKVLPLPGVQGTMRLAGVEESELLIQWGCAFHREGLGKADDEGMRKIIQKKIGDGELFLWCVDGKAFAMAAKTRETVHGVVVSLVYTPPENRGKGYATQLVGELSQLMLASGHSFCALFTDLANPTSNSIYQKIGYYPVGDMDEYVFLPMV
ncbi:MAG: hypothetical protein CVU39_04635 [Chloroflexi bacterium HGW-Chloroflexi-10]|nr:MAG: hypothetical protein CVU39_04635 [Chloroflexi bacterium HGW-Chloroflexi-10]